MAILSSVASTSILASVTSVGGVAGAVFGGLGSKPEAPELDIQRGENTRDGGAGKDDIKGAATLESSGQDTDDQDGNNRPIGRPGRSLAALDLQTQTAAQDVGTTEEVENNDGETPTAAAPDDAGPEKTKTNSSGEDVDENGLTEAERRQVEQLKQRDREVKEHERAHAAAGGGIAGQPNYQYATGPDGNQYAVAGEVRINTTPVRGNPEATIRKLEQVKRAALAPREPSGQDRRVAASADAGIAAARQEVAAQKREEAQNSVDRRAEGETLAADRSSRNVTGNEPVFDPEERFRNEVRGISAAPQTGLAGAGVLQTNVGLSDPGQLFSLVA